MKIKTTSAKNNLKVRRMKQTKLITKKSSLVSATLGAMLILSNQALAASLPMETIPLYTAPTADPLLMLIVGKDHTLFSEAYNDTVDLDKDNNNTIDNRYTPTYAYGGYFGSELCYQYSSEVFRATGPASGVSCGSGWHGNFLNYLTMSRMDILRQSLYGGYRQRDTQGETILERAFLPPDGHGWAKSYDPAVDTHYNITDVSPLANNSQKYLFANASFQSSQGKPLLRYIPVPDIVNPWDWASENPMLILTAPSSTRPNSLTTNNSGNLTDLVVRVEVCDGANMDASRCQQYPNGNYKPTGLLHTFSENSNFQFGLITGSYDKNLSGGVLRKGVSSFLDEVRANNGRFKNSANTSGIVGTLNKIRITGFDLADPDDGYGNWNVNNTDRSDIRIENNALAGRRGECKHTKYKNEPLRENGQCTAWGNPIGEMLFESLRYFSGETQPSSTYSPTSTMLDLPQVTNWTDPFDGANKCSKAGNLIISDINPSYDSDELPGAPFSGSYSGALRANSPLANFHASNLLNDISTNENINGSYFIGDSENNNGVSNSYLWAPTPKPVSNLNSIRGLPAEPSKEGSYTSAAVAYFAQHTGITSKDGDEKKIPTLAVAMSPPLPVIEIPMDNGNGVIKIIPFAKFPAQSDGNNLETFPNPPQANKEYAGTSGIVDYYIDNPTDTLDNITQYRVNYEEVEYGSDYDMDMIVTYTVTKFDEQNISVQVTRNDQWGGSGIVHAGYIISGVTGDNNVFLDVRSFDSQDADSNDGRGRAAYFLDTHTSNNNTVRGKVNGKMVDRAWTSFSNNGTNQDMQLPPTRTRNFSYNSSQNVTAAQQLESPLYYAAKYGNKNFNENTNYFAVEDPSQLNKNITDALNNFEPEKLTSTAPIFNATRLVDGSLFYQNTYENEFWTGSLFAYSASNGVVDTSIPLWDASDLLLQRMLGSTSSINDDGNRTIYTSNGSTVFEFDTSSTSINSLTNAQKAYLTGLDPNTATTFDPVKLNNVIRYLRGNPYMSGLNIDASISDPSTSSNYVVPTGFRGKNRSKDATALGAIINSTPYFIGPVGKYFGHNVARKALAFGANDGMVHIIDAGNGPGSGEEIFAYMPSMIYGKEFANASTSSRQGLYESTQEGWQYLPTVDGGITGYTDQLHKTTIAGSLGLQFPGLYAIDVSDLNNVSSSNIKWEITTSTTGYQDIGVTKQAPQIVRINHNGNEIDVVIFTNGYNSGQPSGNKNGILYFADLNDGSLLFTLDTQTAGPNATSNPLSRPAIVDLDGDGIMDKIYVGDSLGNLWAFSEHNSVWDFARDSNNDPLAVPLFTALSPDLDLINGGFKRQPITAQPQVTRHPHGIGSGVLINFGTGRYATANDHDPINQVTQSLYVIHDDSENHQSEPLNAPRSISSGDYDGLPPIANGLQKLELLSELLNQRQFSAPSSMWDNNKKGLYVDLRISGQSNAGERVISSNLVNGSSVTFVSMTPVINTCDLGANSWFYTIDFVSGKVVYTRKEKGIQKLGGTVYNYGDPHDPSTGGVSGTSSGVEKIENGNGGGYKKIEFPEKPEGKLNWRELLF